MTADRPQFQAHKTSAGIEFVLNRTGDIVAIDHGKELVISPVGLRTMDEAEFMNLIDIAGYKGA